VCSSVWFESLAEIPLFWVRVRVRVRVRVWVSSGDSFVLGGLEAWRRTPRGVM